METVLNYVYTLWNQIIYALSNIRIQDILDIIIIAFLLLKAIDFFRQSRAGQLVKGIVVLLAAYLLADWWNLVMLKWLLVIVMDSAIIIVAVIFQPELRRILERLGRTKFGSGGQYSESDDDVSQCIDNICKAAGNMQERKIGALIVFERETQLGEIINTGTVIDATASVAMTGSIFFPNSPLHDGALIVRDGRLHAAGCILPLSPNQDLSSTLGTRHRAGIGMTENSDAVVLIVSEETGIISIVKDGQIKRNYNAASACAELRRLLLDDESRTKENVVFSTVKRFVPFIKKQSEQSQERGKDE